MAFAPSRLLKPIIPIPNAINLNRYFIKLNPYYRLNKIDIDETLIFESRFESGNLKKATQIDNYQYDLTLKCDHKSEGNFTQWFYFKVSNTRKDRQYIFHIVNFIKPDSLYNNGMKPLIYSRLQAQNEGTGWRRGGEDITYYQTPVQTLAK